MTIKKYMQEDIADSPEDQKKLANVRLDETVTDKESGDQQTGISPLENDLLNDSFDPSYDRDLPIQSLALDDKDNEGDLLEEGGQNNDLFGRDLDDSLIKEEDEETTGEGQQ